MLFYCNNSKNIHQVFTITLEEVIVAVELNS